MAFFHSNRFKYFKNLLIGLGAALVMLGALWKIQSWPAVNILGLKIDMLTVGLFTEAFLFTILGLLPPEKEYYWEKLYPGLDISHGGLAGGAGSAVTPLNGEVVERQLDGMVAELQNMSKSLGSLKALQEIDFSSTKDQLTTMGNFYSKMNMAMTEMSEATEDAKVYRERLGELNTSLGSMNSVYGDVVNTVGRMNDAIVQLGETVEDTKQYKEHIDQLNRNLVSLNGVYGGVLSAFKG